MQQRSQGTREARQNEAGVAGALDRLARDDRDSALTRAECDVLARRIDGGWEITVVARSLVRDLTLLVDKLDPDARGDDALVTLLPGERALLRISGADDVSAESFYAPHVLRSGNDLVVRAARRASQAPVDGGRAAGREGVG